MSYKDKYFIRDKMYGDGLREIKINNMIRKIQSTFADSPSYYRVLMSTPLLSVEEAYEIDAQIVDNTDLRDEKKITTMNDVELYSGNYVKWLDKYWLVTHFDHMGDIYKRGVLNRCYTTLRWQDENRIIREAWFSKKTDVSPNFGIDDRNKIITMPDERRQIVVQSNEHTQKLKKEQRFILDGRAWKIITLDDIAEGIINIVLHEDQINPATDNLELRIVDYIEDVFTLTIKNDQPTSINVNQSLLLDIRATKNGTAVGMDEIILSSSNPQVGTINNDGLFTPVGVGSTTVVAEYKGIQQSVDIIVRDIMINNYTVDINGPDNITFGMSKEYQAVFRNNGNVIDEQCEFTLEAANGLASVKSIINNSIIISANNNSKVGSVLLKVKSKNNLMHGEKQIRIKGYL